MEFRQTWSKHQSQVNHNLKQKKNQKILFNSIFAKKKSKNFVFWRIKKKRLFEK